MKRLDEKVKDVWALVFKMPADTARIWRENEQLSTMDEGDSHYLHVGTESEEDLQARTIHIGDIPEEHVIGFSDAGGEPSLSDHLMAKLGDHGDVDTVTVRARNGVQGLSWALVTYEDIAQAHRAIETGVSVSGEDHTSGGHHMVPDKNLIVAQADLTRKTTGSYARQKMKHEGAERLFRAMPITHEAWAFCNRCLACDIEISHHLTGDRQHLIITLAATIDTLIQEAKLGSTVMRLAETKGSMFFHPDLVHYYASNHGGLNETTVENLKTKWLPRDETLAPNWAMRPEVDPEGKMPWEFSDNKARHIFTSAHAQRLVMKRMKRVGRIDPEQQLSNSSGKFTLRYVKNRVVKKKKITAENCHELLLAFGGFRPHSQDVFPKVQGKPVITMLAEACHKDPMWILHSDGLLQSNTFTDIDRNLPTYSMIIDVCRVIEAWSDGVGREEQFVGSLKDFFPTHDDTEIAYLKRDWARFGILYQQELIGFEPEKELKVKVVLGKVQTENKYFENNTFGSEANTPTRFTWPGLLFYQPLEEIHDYFGDDVGLYFAWLDKYTRALFLMSFYGTFVMSKQVLYHDGPDDNPLTLVYSIYVGAWSILFLQAWNRRETELRFLWGLDRLQFIDEARREFKHGTNSALQINPDTGRQQYVVKSQITQLLHKVVSAVCVAFMMVVTVVSATAAILVRYIEQESVDPEDDILIAHGSDTGDLPETSFMQHYVYSRYYELLSAFLGLFIIVLYGMIFEGIASKLNDYENHRTQQEHDDALILKNFAFQFLNNYWALIYIAYLREIEDPFTGQTHPCEQGTCMSELQFQLLVVFSFKTIGKQIGFTLRPFVFKFVKLLLANRHLNKAMKLSGEVTKNTIKKIPGGEAAVEMQEKLTEGVMDLSGDVLDAALGAEVQIPSAHGLNKFEVQDSLMTYTGTFNDFNDRTVQFGYIVLFAPAFPAAPVLAFLNNILEIRAAGYKLCHGYRRPRVKDRTGLGTWAVVLNTLGFLAVIMNSTMINFVGRQNARSFGVPDTPGHWEDESTVMYNKDLAGGYGIRSEDNSGLHGRSNVAALWLRFFAVEHCSMAVRILILFLTPDLPTWIKTARETLDFRQRTVYQTNEALEQEKRYREKYEAKLNSHMDDIKEHLEAAMQKESLTALFDRLDADGSGTLARTHD